MRLTSLRNKIVIYSSALLVVLIAAMLFAVNYQGESFVADRMKKDVGRGWEEVHALEEQRMADLRETAANVSVNTNLKPLFFLPDGGLTIRSEIEDYQKAHKKTDLLVMALRADGEVFARSDRSDARPIPSLTAALVARPDLVNSKANTVLEVDGAAFHVAIVSVPDTSGQVYGYVFAGAPLDDAFVRKLRANSGVDDIVLATGNALLSTQPTKDLPWSDQKQWTAAVVPDAPPVPFDVGGGPYQGMARLLGSDPGVRPVVIVMQSHDKAIAPYKQIQKILLGIGLFVAIVGVALSTVFARSVTAPVAKLVEGTRQVAVGNFEWRLDVWTSDEIGELAQSFNTMTRGLRERADMQKFVSQSTVDMIEARGQKKVSGGERVTLTVFFSDMRGFTAMTENAPPEETVRMLNSCLSLQAARVKKFHGDIDKYVGDCVVALFTGEDMELNAIRCAVEIHKALDALNEANPDHAALRVGIGIVRGEVVLGSIGSEDRLDYTVIGSNVNLCSRLCSSAGPRETLISESTFSAVEGLIAAEKLDPIHVKGFTGPIQVFRVGGSQASRTGNDKKVE